MKAIELLKIISVNEAEGLNVAVIKENTELINKFEDLDPADQEALAEDRYEYIFLSRNFKFDFDNGVIYLYFGGFDSLMDVDNLRNILKSCKSLEKSIKLNRDEESWFHPFNEYKIRIIDALDENLECKEHKECYDIDLAYVFTDTSCPILALKVSRNFYDLNN